MNGTSLYLSVAIPGPNLVSLVTPGTISPGNTITLESTIVSEPRGRFGRDSGCEIKCSMMVEHVFMIVLLLHLAVSVAEFNYTKCPSPFEIQSDTVRKTFNLTKFVGNYYELAMHDYTQYPVCFLGPKCIKSHKVLDYTLKQINDTFSLKCGDETFTVPLKFKLTDIPGHFNGTWSHIPGLLFPDTVVDVYESSDGIYQWVIEFQCVEKFDHVWFVGINWYSRIIDTSQEYLNSIIQAARARGLGLYMDHGTKIYYVNQTNC